MKKWTTTQNLKKKIENKILDDHRERGQKKNTAVSLFIMKN